MKFVCLRLCLHFLHFSCCIVIVTCPVCIMFFFASPCSIKRIRFSCVPMCLHFKHLPVYICLSLRLSPVRASVMFPLCIICLVHVPWCPPWHLPVLSHTQFRFSLVPVYVLDFCLCFGPVSRPQQKCLLSVKPPSASVSAFVCLCVLALQLPCWQHAHLECHNQLMSK